MHVYRTNNQYSYSREQISFSGNISIDHEVTFENLNFCVNPSFEIFIKTIELQLIPKNVIIHDILYSVDNFKSKECVPDVSIN